MFNLFQSADAFLKESDWKDLALVKVCLFSVGMLTALRLPIRKAATAQKWARRLFVVTYVPLMAKYARIVKSMER